MSILDKTPGTSTDTLKGFTPVKADSRGAQIEREDLTDGVIVRHIGTRNIDTDRARGLRHTFKTRGGQAGGLLFEIWGTSEINDMLKKLRAGVILYLRYGGKQAHPEIPGADVHKWDVRDSRHTELTDELRDAVKDNMGAQVALETKIDAAKLRERERFQEQRRTAIERGEAPPPQTDDDLPF